MLFEILKRIFLSPPNDSLAEKIAHSYNLDLKKADDLVKLKQYQLRSNLEILKQFSIRNVDFQKMSRQNKEEKL